MIYQYNQYKNNYNLKKKKFYKLKIKQIIMIKLSLVSNSHGAIQINHICITCKADKIYRLRK